MPNQQTSGILTGAASGAGAGASAGPWGALIGGVAGGVLGGIGGSAGDAAAARARRLQMMRDQAQQQVEQFGVQSNAAEQDRLRQLAAQRYASYGALANQLGGPERTAAGTAAGMDYATRLAAAQGGVAGAPVGNRALVGGAASPTAINAQLDPVLAARRQALTQNRMQTGVQDYDTRAFNQQANASTDISRQANEEAQRQNALAEVRQRMLAQAGVQYADQGPTNGENNQMLLSQLGLAGLQVGGSAYAVNRENQRANASRFIPSFPRYPTLPAGYAGPVAP